MRISYEKALNKLKEHKLSDGKIFVIALKNYILFEKNYIFTTNDNQLTITPFSFKNAPHTNDFQFIKKENIERFVAVDNFFFARKFNIILKSGKQLKYTTHDINIKQRVNALNDWLKD